MSQTPSEIPSTTPRQRRRRTTSVIRRVVLLALVVGCLAAPVIAIAVETFDSHGGGTSSELVCSQPTDPCQLPRSAASP
jgi:hypothetical protein